jgi:hypothetical protein
MACCIRAKFDVNSHSCCRVGTGSLWYVRDNFVESVLYWC